MRLWPTTSRQTWQLIIEALRTSLWFVPLVMLALALPLAGGAHVVDAILLRRPGAHWPLYIYVSDPSNARDVLSTLLSSMMTMTSLVFSITMVVLTLAANQFGPRLIRNFMALPLTQVALGTFVMTSGYCLLSLGLIASRSTDGQQPFATVSLAILLTFACIIVLVVFLHTLARSIVSETVIRRVGREVDDFVDALEPLADAANGEMAAPVQPMNADAVRFGPLRDGYVQAIHLDQLLGPATVAGVFVDFTFRPGDYVAAGGSGIAVSPASRCTEDLRAAALAAVVIGSHRTPNQDPEFSIRHLVEIAVRALSPGINDPYTASAVVDQLSACLSRLVGRKLPAFRVTDDDGIPRAACQGPTYASLVGAAFNQIRQNAAGKPMVLIHLVEAIGRIAERAPLAEQREALRGQLDALSAALDETNVSVFDREGIRARATDVYATLSRRTGVAEPAVETSAGT